MYQNAKQEAFWGPVEGRLLAMLEHVGDLTLAFLNEATQAWVEHEYNARIHAEIGVAPITRFLAGHFGRLRGLVLDGHEHDGTLDRHG